MEDNTQLTVYTLISAMFVEMFVVFQLSHIVDMVSSTCYNAFRAITEQVGQQEKRLNSKELELLLPS